MKIILVQAEIELAIRAYVLSQIAVKDGQDITIDFKNTRGDDGTTAEINITNPSLAAGNVPVKAVETVATTPAPKTPAKPSTPSAAPAAAATKPIASTTEQSAPSASTTSEPEQEETLVPERTVPFDADEPVDGGDTPDVTETLAKTEAPVKKPSFLSPAPAATEEAPPPSSGKSLFANLTKPVNPKPTAE